MLDTITHLKRQKIGYTGAGRNIDEAYKPYVQNINGKSRGVGRQPGAVGQFLDCGQEPSGRCFRLHDGADADPYQEIRKTNDYTIVYIHWNQEFADYPEEYARTMAKKMIDAGADIIIGSHSHTLMGIEYYKNKPIYYSLGNFVFNRSTRAGTKPCCR